MKTRGPLLLCCNHPNSFLDAVIIDVIFREPVYSLARGDAFKNPVIAWILKHLKMFPVYRASEGACNLHVNYKTFDACKSIFRKNGVVQIFSEGRCINEWHLRPLKKGTARLAISSWETGIPLQVLPVGINYSSYRRFGKNVFINFGNFITAADVDSNLSTGLKHQAFNDRLQAELSALVFEIDQGDREKQKALLVKKPPAIKSILLFLPAMLGWLLNILIYLPVKKVAVTYAGHNDHHDSVFLALLFVVYPFYLLAVFSIVYALGFKWMAFGSLLVLPFTAWAYVQVKPLLDEPVSR